MSDQAHYWSQAAPDYEVDFIDSREVGANPTLRESLAALAGPGKTVADLGCGIGPLLPDLAQQFGRVIAVDFAAGMLERARERCEGLENVEFLHSSLTDLTALHNQVDVAVAINSLVLPCLDDLELALDQVRRILKPGGQFLGILPAIDAVHYVTMVLLDRARRRGLPEDQARQNAAAHAEHHYFDFAFSTFSYRGLEQHFWQPFEIPYRLGRAGFHLVRLARAALPWSQVVAVTDIEDPPPWDWFFQAEPVRDSSEAGDAREGS
jgi:ubiquinone/menaquinone biosynthesis C-methylase UbiE